MGVGNAIECWFLQHLVLGIRSSVGTLASVLPWLPTIWSSASTHQLYSARTLKGLKLCFRNSALSSEVPLSVLPLGQDLERSHSSSTLVLPGLPNMGMSTSAFHLCRDFQRCEVPLPHFCSALTAKDLKFRFPYFRPVMTSKDLVRLPHLFCQDFQVWVSPLPHFISAGTFKDVKLRFRTSALTWLPKFWSSAFRTSARPGLERSRSSSTLVLPGLPNMHKSTSAFARTSKDLKFRFHSSALPWLPKDVKFCFPSSAVRSCYAFPHKFVRLQRDESGKNRYHLIDFTVSQA